MNIDLEEAKWFLHILDPEATKFTFQVFMDDKKAIGTAKIIHGEFDKIAPKLSKLNKQGYGIFVTVNKTDLKGRKTGNIVRIRAVWIEDDEGSDDDLPIDPHIVVETSSGKFHYYFLTDHDILEDFGPVQERLVQDHGSDKNAKDISRVLRLPGFFHQKNPDKPFLTKIDETNVIPRYSWEEIENAFPPIEKTPKEKKGKTKPEGKKKIRTSFKYAKVRSALHAIDPDCEYQDWIDIGMAIHRESNGSSDGLELYDQWSSGSFWSKRPEKYVEGEAEEKWGTFSPNKITIKSLYKKASQDGWNSQYRYNKGTQADKEAINRERVLFLNDFNRKYGVIIIEGQTLIVCKKPDVKGGNKIEFMKVADFKLFHQNITIPTIKKGKVVTEKICPVWLEYRNRRQYKNGVCFNPIKGMYASGNLSLPEAKNGFLELFTGFAIKPKEGTCRLIKNHLGNVWCSGNREHYKYVMDWLARMFQIPNKPGQTAIVLRSGEGVGKNIILDFIVEYFGPHAKTLTRSRDITGQFTDHLATSIFVSLNEAVWGGDKQLEGPLKAMITDKTFLYEKKYLSKFEVNNCLHIVMSSNSEWIAPVGMDDRRYFFLDLSEKKKKDPKYFLDLGNEIENGGKEAFLDHLLKRDISDFNPHNMPISTSSTRKDNKLKTYGSVGKWLEEIIDDGFIPGSEDSHRETLSEFEWSSNATNFVTSAALHGNYREWCKKQNERRPETKGGLTKKIRQLFPKLTKTCRKRGKRGLTFPAIEKMRGQWNSLLTG